MRAAARTPDGTGGGKGVVMDDIRKSVEEDRGLLKKLQLVIPGFRGYRKREDIRQADNLLRIQMADRIQQVKSGLEDCRRAMVESFMPEHMDKVGGVINKMQALDGKVRHAEQGYTGFSPAIRIEETELNAIYEYDIRMVTSINQLEESVTSLRNAVYANDAMTINQHLEGIRAQLGAFTTAFEERIPRIAGIYNM